MVSSVIFYIIFEPMHELLSTNIPSDQQRATPLVSKICKLLVCNLRKHFPDEFMASITSSVFILCIIASIKGKKDKAGYILWSVFLVIDKLLPQTPRSQSLKAQWNLIN